MHVRAEGHTSLVVCLSGPGRSCCLIRRGRRQRVVKSPGHDNKVESSDVSGLVILFFFVQGLQVTPEGLCVVGRPEDAGQTPRGTGARALPAEVVAATGGAGTAGVLFTAAWFARLLENAKESLFISIAKR